MFLAVVPVHEADTLEDNQLIFDLELLSDAEQLIDNEGSAVPGNMFLSLE